MVVVTATWYLTEAVRERCSRESMTQPTWHSRGGLELWRVFLFLGVWRGGETGQRGTPGGGGGDGGEASTNSSLALSAPIPWD